MKPITIDQVRIFEKFGGDSDGFARVATDPECEVMTEDVWPRIDSLVQSLVLIERGLAASGFVKESIRLLHASVEGVEAEKAIRRIALTAALKHDSPLIQS